MSYLLNLSTILLVAFLCSCNSPSSTNGNNVRKNESVSDISCKNETSEKLWDAQIEIGGRKFGLGLIGPNKKATMVVGDLSTTKTVIVIYSFYPKDGNPNSVINKTVEYRGEKLVSLAKSISEVEVVCKGDEKWTLRAYEHSPDLNGKMLFEEDMKNIEKK